MSSSAGIDSTRGGETPNLILLGPGRTGTTALYHALRRCGVESLGTKEFNTLLQDDIEEIRKYILPIGPHQSYVVDATPGYFIKSDIVSQRIQTVYRNPAAIRFIVIYRDPIERAESDFHHKVAAGLLAPERFDDYASGRATAAELQRWTEILSASRYRTHLSNWFRYFSAEKFLILDSADVKRNNQATAGRLSVFLGLELPDFYATLDNKQSDPRFPRIQRFKHNPSRLKDMLKLAIPYRTRRKISAQFHALNYRPAKERRRLNDAQRATLAALIGPNEALTRDEIATASLGPGVSAPEALAD